MNIGLIPTSSHHFPSNTFEEFKAQFTYQGQALFTLLFERHPELIKSKKAAIAANNLQKIFDATFRLSAKMGFQKMSLRDLSTATGLSMGSLYSCIRKKEDIALMVLDLVELVSADNNQKIATTDNEICALEMAIRYHLYSSTLLQPWFFFLYFETRCLDSTHQEKSKAIERYTIKTFEKIIQSGVDKSLFKVNTPYFAAQTILIIIQDWYLKPWKNKENNIDLEDYSKELFSMVRKLLRFER